MKLNIPSVHINRLITTSTLLTLLFLLLDTFIYPGFVARHIVIDPITFFLIYLTFVLILSAKGIKVYSSRIKKINNNIIFPLLFFSFLIFIYLEKTQYINFVFSHFHIHLLMYIYLTVLSGTIFYITFPRFKQKPNGQIYYKLPLILIITFFIYTYFPAIFGYIVREDGPAESIQFILYFFAAIYSFKISKYFRKANKSKIYSIGFLLFSIGLFFIAFEEISWGQRIIGLETPSGLREINVQDEISFHNIDIIQYNFVHSAYIIFGAYGMLSQLILRKFFSKKFKHLTIFTPPFYLLFCFFALFSFYVLFDYFNFLYVLTPSTLANPVLHQEIAETYLSLALFIYAHNLLKKLQNKDAVTLSLLSK